MDNLELIKENVQPLKSGRKIDSLTAALNSDPNETRRREEIKMEYEAKLKDSTDEELLEVYHCYVNWIEQNYPQGGKDSNLKNILEQCIQKFYNEEKFKNSEKLLSLFLKYTSILNDPLELFNFFYKSGFGKRLSQFYISWSYYFETQNNFKRAIKVVEAGIHNKAEPVAVLNQALNDLQVRTMRHVISHPEDSEKTERKALNSLKAKVDAHGKAEAPVKRTGNVSIKVGGLRNPMDKATKVNIDQLNVLCDENAEPVPSAAPRFPIPKQADTNKLPIGNQENERDPGKWNENKLNSKALKRPVISSFEIHEDNNEKVEPEENIKPLPSKSAPEFPVAKFEEKNHQVKYIWYSKMDQMYRDNTEYSFEEVRYKQWLENAVKREVSNETKQESISIKEDSSSVSKTYDSSEVTEAYGGQTSIVRDFYNGTLSTSVYPQDQVDTKNNTKVADDVTIAEVKNENNFQIFSDTTDRFNCTESPNNVTLNCENQMKPSEFTISVLKDDEFKSCSSSTPYVNKTFKPPQNLTMKFRNHPNFVNGITAKVLSPISETSRDCISKSSSSSSGTMSSTASTWRKQFSLPETINPFEKDLRSHLLQSLAESVECRKGISITQGALPSIGVNGEIFVISAKSYFAKLQLGGNAKAFLVDRFYANQDPEECETSLLKVDGTPNQWDFYIRDELHRRLDTQTDGCIITLSLMPMNETVLFKNGSLSLHDGIPFATLQQAIDHYRLLSQPFPEILIKHFTLELMLIIQKFHQSNIIHADLSAENILLFNMIYDVNLLGKETQTLRFLDFSRAIDMRLLPEGTVFNKNYTESSKSCYSILNSTNWTYLIDWIGLLNCIHLMYFGVDMKVCFENSAWKLEKPFSNEEQQYLNGLFDLLLNLKPNQTPNLDAYINKIIIDLKEAHLDLVDAFLLFKFEQYERYSTI